ncbi:putative nuclease of RNase H fold RuvC/YqgF family [Methanonatronarchaeum thermophilum]|uniref:Putative nuclease of RNase H fold RuvC/YqgF family n=1 Tax=Methanonatronarchaeum thermophilum TaxID=1927129 RepID=A0A1Y3GDM5_9EURY|nr:DUF460 domain-containing protein [Methanonatronarchaeum thermophilum]OUJ19509.1 putative nuclease of RNase H fold RuvC/YqgF family [Methanonatronarchaeum thermophilum]
MWVDGCVNKLNIVVGLFVYLVLGWFVLVRRKYLFVGVDPGTTTGVGVVDFDGRVVEVCSGRDMSFDDVVGFLVGLGNVVVVATDVSPAPDFVEQLSTVLDAVLWVPSSSLKREVKRDLVRDFDCGDKHQVDALAAAFKAYRSMKGKLRRVESNVPDDVSERDAKKLVLKGNSLQEAVRSLRSEREQDVVDEDEVSQEVVNRIHGLENKVVELQETVEKLRREKEEKENEITELKSELARIKSKRFLNAITSQEVEDKKEEINSLKRELKEEKKRVKWLKQKLQDAEEIDQVRNNKNITVMKKLTSFTMKKIKQLEQGIGINEGDIIYIEDPSGGGSTNAERLSKKVRAIAHKAKLSHPAKQKFKEKETPIITLNQIKDHGNYVTAPKQKVEKEIQKAKQKLKQEKKEQLKSLKEKYGHDKDIEL